MDRFSSGEQVYVRKSHLKRFWSAIFLWGMTSPSPLSLLVNFQSLNLGHQLQRSFNCLSMILWQGFGTFNRSLKQNRRERHIARLDLRVICHELCFQLLHTTECAVILTALTIIFLHLYCTDCISPKAPECLNSSARISCLIAISKVAVIRIDAPDF